MVWWPFAVGVGLLVVASALVVAGPDVVSGNAVLVLTGTAFVLTGVGLVDWRGTNDLREDVPTAARRRIRDGDGPDD